VIRCDLTQLNCSRPSSKGCKLPSSELASRSSETAASTTLPACRSRAADMEATVSHHALSKLGTCALGGVPPSSCSSCARINCSKSSRSRGYLEGKGQWYIYI
jgi:hypothetical protein